MTAATITRKKSDKKQFPRRKTVPVHPTIAGAAAETLSQDALYLLVLADRLKKLLGPASLPHFLTTGETRVFHSTVNH